MKSEPDRDGVLVGHVTDCAHWLQTTERAIYHLAERQQIPFRKRGGRLIFRKADIEAYLNRLEGVDVDTAIRNVETRR